MKLRPYQQQAFDNTIAALSEHRSTLIVLPTGTGKTVVFSHLVEHYAAGGRVLVLAHREELINQASSKIQAVSGIEPAIEMADQWAPEDSVFGRSQVIVSSIQTQATGRMNRFRPDDFSLIIVDEAHHAAAKSYKKVIGHYMADAGCKLVGVTATPDRSDEVALGEVFDSVAMDYEISDAVRDGWLVPIKQRSIIVDGLDFSKVRTVGGDLNGRDLAALMEAEGPLHEVTTPAYELTIGRKVLVFSASVAHAELMCEIFNRHESGSARWVCGTTPKDERRQMLQDYAAGSFRILVNVGVLTEGFDDPSIEVVVMARPTKSRSLYAQMVGRGTRPLPTAGIDLLDGEDADGRRSAIAASTKPAVEIMDFVGNAGRHKLITAVDILAGRSSDAVAQRAKAKAKSGQAGDVQEAIDEAEREIHEERKHRDAERKKQLVAKARYTVEDVNPFDALDIEAPRVKGWDRVKRASNRQVAYLKGEGIDASKMKLTEASTLINEINDRRKRGECGLRQARILAKHGATNTRVTSAEANILIQRIYEQRRSGVGI